VAKAAVPALAEALKKDKHENVRNAATEALKKIQQKQGISARERVRRTSLWATFRPVPARKLCRVASRCGEGHRP
jgi:HEAT repeat protein